MTLPGVDYQNTAQSAAYDRRHGRFRDYAAQTRHVLATLELGPDATVIDMGAGTGAFAIHAAPHCQTIYAVDISPAMLDYCRQKAAAAHLENIVFAHGGFLTYEHSAAPVDAVVSMAVLHHLPDFWKFVGLQRVAAMLKPGGKFYLFDVVFPAAMPDPSAQLQGWVDDFAGRVGDEFRPEVETHIREEYSTFDWIMENLLRQAGFHIASASYNAQFSATYVCVKP